MIPKKEWLKYKKEHPSICATCFHYQVSKNNDYGYCYGLPPVNEKSIKVKPHRRACSLHQSIISDIIRLSVGYDLLSSVVSALTLFTQSSQITSQGIKK